MNSRKPTPLNASFLARKGAASAAGFADPNTDPPRSHPEASKPTQPSEPPKTAEPETAEARRPKENCGITKTDEIPVESRANGDRQDKPAKTVLIVEDDPQNMNLFAELLRIYGCATVQAQDGKEALERARTHRPDLILLDIQLPDMSGTQVAARIKGDRDLAPIPIVAITAFVADELEEKIRGIGCEEYVTKPITMFGFFETLEKYLG